MTLPALETVLSAPPFSSPVEIWTYILDMSKIWSNRVYPRNRYREYFVHENVDCYYGGVVTGGLFISSVLADMYDDTMSGHKTAELRELTQRCCNNHKFSNLLRFIRNFTQHAQENLSEDLFIWYFSSDLRKKHQFLQYLIKKVPRLLVYTWIVEHPRYLRETFATRDCMSYVFIRWLEESLRNHKDDNHICTITISKSGGSVELDVLQCNTHIFERMYGTVIKIKKARGKSFMEVIWEANEDPLKFPIETPNPFCLDQCNICFGSHTEISLEVKKTILFIMEKNIQDVARVIIPQEDVTSATIETTQLLREEIIDNANVQINGACIPVKCIHNDPKANLEFIDNSFDTWRKIIRNEPFRIYTKGPIHERRFETCDQKQRNNIIQRAKGIHIITGNDVNFRTNWLKDIHNELSKTNRISLFVPVPIDYERLNNTNTNLKQSIIKLLRRNKKEKILLTKLFEASSAQDSPKVFILFDGIDKISPEKLPEFSKKIEETPIRLIGTSEHPIEGFERTDISPNIENGNEDPTEEPIVAADIELEVKRATKRPMQTNDDDPSEEPDSKRQRREDKSDT